MLGREIREPYPIIPADPSVISKGIFLSAAKPDGEDKNRIIMERDNLNSDAVKASLLLMVLSF
jgi:hypothetical protein